MFKPFQPAPWIALIALAALPPSSATADERPADKPARPGPAFPLKVAEGGRCLVDQNGAPFLITGESPQALMVNLSEEDAELFLANRQSHGFNAVWTSRDTLPTRSRAAPYRSPHASGASRTTGRLLFRADFAT